MNSIRKMLIISFLTIQTGAFALPPIDNCNMNGVWYMERIPAYQFQVVQSGSSIHDSANFFAMFLQEVVPINSVLP